MRHPPFGEANMGALVGAVVGATGGLFAVGVGPAIASRNLALLFLYPTLGLASCLVSGPVAWLLGGQIGPRLGEVVRSQRGEVLGGILGGLIPFIAVCWWGWYMCTR
jgi:hypothetical protein